MQIKLLGADWIEKCKYLSLVVIEESKKIIFEIKIAFIIIPNFSA